MPGPLPRRRAHRVHGGLAYLGRLCISVLAPPVMRDLRLSQM